MGKWRLSEATSDSSSPYNNRIEDALWEPSASDLKTYKHFDAIMSEKAIMCLVRDPNKVATHSFRPLLHFEKSWRRPPKNGVERGKKIRPIRYPCRKDAYIYKHYRSMLSTRYEGCLAKAGLQNTVLAYRRIPVEQGARAGKSNIHFANDAFRCIERLGRCCAVAIDISDYFGSIDHKRLCRVWETLIGAESLPGDHAAVFKSITRYRFVDLTEALIALGYSYRDSEQRLHYKKRPSRIPIQLCTPQEFREKIVDAGLVQKHDKCYGIPQGTPISDLLANAYLFDFDIAMSAYAKEREGHYFRYSDDILIILPGDGRAARYAEKRGLSEISKYGKMLEINPSKTEVVCYTPSAPSPRYYSLARKDENTRRTRKSENEGLSYLGFRYDGRHVFLRNSTITNLRGKIARTCKAAAFEHVYRHREKDLDWLLERSPTENLLQQYLRVEDFEEVVSKERQNGQPFFKNLTFWSYARNAGKVFGHRGRKIKGQLRNIKSMIESTFECEIRKKYRIARRNALLPSHDKSPHFRSGTQHPRGKREQD